MCYTTILWWRNSTWYLSIFSLQTKNDTQIISIPYSPDFFKCEEGNSTRNLDTYKLQILL